MIDKRRRRNRSESSKRIPDAQLSEERFVLKLDGHRAVKIIVSASPELQASVDEVALRLRSLGVDAAGIQDRSGIDAAIDLLRPQPIVLIALAFQHEADAHHSALAVQLRNRNVSWLRTVMSRSCKEFQVGPFFQRERSPCYECALARLPRLESDREEPEPGTRDAAMGLFLSWIVEEVRRLCTESAFTPGTFTAVDLPRRRSRVGIVVRERRCGLCGRENTSPAPRSGYQEAIESLQDYFNAATSGNGAIVRLEPRGHEIVRIAAPWNYDRTCILLPYQGRSGALKKPGLLRSVWGRSPKTLELREIADLLRFTAGFRAVRDADRYGRRWCASAGNLGSVHLGVSSCKVPVLPDGSYFYDGPRHSLGWAPAETFLPMAGTSPSHKQRRPRNVTYFEVRIYGSYERLAGKYGIFASRLVYLDIGAAVAQFVTYAEQLQLRTTLYLPVQTLCGGMESNRDSDRLGAVLTVSSRQAASVPTSSLPAPARMAATPRAANCDKSDPKDMERLILHAEASYGNDASRYRSRHTQAPWLNIPSRKAAALSGKPCEQIFDERRSTRHFSVSSVAREQALGIVSRSLRSFARHTRGIKQPLKAVLVVEKVRGLDRGQYRCQYVNKELRLRPEGFDGTGTPRANTAFRCIVLGRSDGGPEAEALTYSQQLVLAGTLAYLFSLEATAEGLAGSVIARGDPINDLVPRLEMLEDIVLCAFICGCMPESEEVDHEF